VLGWMPRPTDIDLDGLDLDPRRLELAQSMEVEDLKREVLTQEDLFMKLAGDMPKELIFQRELLIARI
jgi:phosphoenolpyruvate carboxykinase (GTP)